MSHPNIAFSFHTDAKKIFYWNKSEGINFLSTKKDSNSIVKILLIVQSL